MDGTTTNVLQFSNTAYNAGSGRLELFGQIDPTALAGPAYQRIYDDSGSYTQVQVGQFYWHAAHQHFHFDNWNKYELWTKADYDNWIASGRSVGQAKKVGSKTTSCVEDEEFIKTLSNTPYPAPFDPGGCQLQSDNTLHEGLSPGWGDTYDYYRYEQWIDLGANGSLTDGSYVLRSVADPNNLIYESSNKNDSSREGALDNEAVTPFTVSGGRILDGSTPTGTVSINHVDSTTTNPSVSVDAIGRDDVSGVDSFKLSNDGTTWSPAYSYTPNSSVPTTVSWNLTDARYGGTAATGTKTLYAQFHDASGTSGATTSDTIVYAGSTPNPPSSAYGKAVYGDNPVAYWRLGEGSGTTAADVMGPHPGSYVNGPSLGQPSLLATDAANASVGFDGVNDSVNVPDAADLRVGAPLSIEAWVKPNSLPGSGGWATIVTKPESYSLQFNGQQLELTVIQSGVRKRLTAKAGSIAGGNTYYVVGVYDGTNEQLYINGQLAASGGLTGPASATSNSLHIGSWDGASEFFNGRIDDVALYSKALTAATVSNHYRAGLGTVPNGYTVSVTRSGTGTGTVSSSPAGVNCGTTCSATFQAGQAVTLTAAATTGSFTGWSGGACTGTATTCTFTPYAATTVTATFN